jgi:hypothetical protein
VLALVDTPPSRRLSGRQRKLTLGHRTSSRRVRTTLRIATARTAKTRATKIFAEWFTKWFSTSVSTGIASRSKILHTTDVLINSLIHQLTLKTNKKQAFQGILSVRVFLRPVLL